MRNMLLAALAAVVVLSLEVGAQDAGSIISTASKAMGTDTLQSVRYTGTGTNNSTGQAYSPGGPWPRFTVTKYVGLVNYTLPVMRQEVVRIDNISPARGGGAGGYNPATFQGGIRPVPGDIIQNTNTDGRTGIGAVNIWLTPHGFLKGAAANASTARVAKSGGRDVVSFTGFGKYTITGTLNNQNLVERVETRIDVSFTGDTLVEGLYSNYKDFGGVKFPTRIEMRQAGHPVLELNVAGVEPNSPVALQVAAPPARGGGPLGAGQTAAGGEAAGPQAKPEQIGRGVWFLNSGAPQTVVVEFRDHLVLVEAPGNDERSMATLAEVKRLFPSKPVRYVVNTHSHADHSGGIRAMVAEGIPIITHEAHKRYYEQQIFRNPHTLNPDRLQRMPRAAVIETVKDKRVLTDGDLTLELYHMRDHQHSEGLLMAYLPASKLLIQADAFAPRPGAPPLPAPSPYTINLVDNVDRLKLDVERVVHVHGGMDPMTAVRQAAGRAAAGR